MRKTNATNPELKSLISNLRETSSKEDVKLWKRVASDLSSSTRQRRVVNLSRIERFTNEDETIIVPGKVLSAGDLNHKVNVAAFGFSKGAVDKIKKMKGNVTTIQELMKNNPKAKGIRIIG